MRSTQPTGPKDQSCRIFCTQIHKTWQRGDLAGIVGKHSPVKPNVIFHFSHFGRYPELPYQQLGGRYFQEKGQERFGIFNKHIHLPMLGPIFNVCIEHAPHSFMLAMESCELQTGSWCERTGFCWSVLCTYVGLKKNKYFNVFH